MVTSFNIIKDSRLMWMCFRWCSEVYLSNFCYSDLNSSTNYAIEQKFTELIKICFERIIVAPKKKKTKLGKMMKRALKRIIIARMWLNWSGSLKSLALLPPEGTDGETTGTYGSKASYLLKLMREQSRFWESGKQHTKLQH